MLGRTCGAHLRRWKHWRWGGGRETSATIMSKFSLGRIEETDLMKEHPEDYMGCVNLPSRKEAAQEWIHHSEYKDTIVHVNTYYSCEL